jgi:hypothetical protein
VANAGEDEDPACDPQRLQQSIKVLPPKKSYVRSTEERTIKVSDQAVLKGGGFHPLGVDGSIWGRCGGAGSMAATLRTPKGS